MLSLLVVSSIGLAQLVYPCPSDDPFTMTRCADAHVTRYNRYPIIAAHSNKEFYRVHTLVKGARVRYAGALYAVTKVQDIEIPDIRPIAPHGADIALMTCSSRGGLYRILVTAKRLK